MSASSARPDAEPESGVAERVGESSDAAGLPQAREAELRSREDRALQRERSVAAVEERLVKQVACAHLRVCAHARVVCDEA